MTARFRITEALLDAIRLDLDQPHAFAAERVGWIFTETVDTSEGPLLLAVDYERVQDADYVRDATIGARFNGTTIRAALARALKRQQGVFLVHTHNFEDWPSFSQVDLETARRLLPAFYTVSRNAQHGAVVVGRRALSGCIRAHDGGLEGLRCSVVGSHLSLPRTALHEGDRWARQSYLGADAQKLIGSARIGIVGLGGGGSHIAQQAAFAGFLDYVLPDPDVITETNLNRTVTAEAEDVAIERPKTEAAGRTITRVLPQARVQLLHGRWQDHAALLRTCDVILACVDSFTERDQLEVLARRFLIPLIDIGMDVFPAMGSEPPRVVGQVFASIPDSACFRCARIITDELLAREAERYGAAGPAPQVVWSNGSLASAAIGILVELVTGWSGRRGPWFLSYDGNALTLQPHPLLKHLPAICPHYADEGQGMPKLMAR